VAQLVEALRSKPEGHGLDYRSCHWNFSLTIIPHDRLLMKLGSLGHGFEGSHLGKGIPCRSYTKGQIRRATIQGSESNLRCAVRERFGPTAISSVSE
jgi:hypothetical protein